jgi:hypothetical protein
VASTGLYKPVRSKSAGVRRAKILYERQYRHEKIKSVKYQSVRLHKFGPELCFINSAMALSETANYFNREYGDNLHTKHALTIIHVKHICVANNLEIFRVEDLIESDFHLDKQLGFFLSDVRYMKPLLADLVRLKFLNRIGRRYTPTTRVKMFCSIMEKYCKEYFGV